MQRYVVGLGLIVAILACVDAAEKPSDTSVMVTRFVDYAKSFLTKTSNEARIFFDDDDLEGVFGLIIGCFFLLIILSIIPGILSIFAGPLLALLMNTNTANTGINNGLGLTGLGANIPTINVNEAAGRRKRSVSSHSFFFKLASNSLYFTHA